MPSERYTIAFCGQVSAGKSEINCTLPAARIARVALQRETLAPTITRLYTNGSYQDALKLENMIDKIPKGTEIVERGEGLRIWSPLGLDVDIIDFPGINDAADTNGEFYGVLTKHLPRCDVLVYVTNAETAFCLDSEVQLFEKIKAQVKNINDNGSYLRLIVLVNKFDDVDDKEINEIFKRIPYEDKYRFSAHNMFVHLLKIHNIVRKFKPEHSSEILKIFKSAGVIIDKTLKDNIIKGAKISFGDLKQMNEYSGDPDNLVEMLRTIKISDKSFESMLAYIKLHSGNIALAAKKFKIQLEKSQACFDNKAQRGMLFSTLIEIFKKNDNVQFVVIFDILSTINIVFLRELVYHCLDNICSTAVLQIILLKYCHLIECKKRFIEIFSRLDVWINATASVTYTDVDGKSVVLNGGTLGSNIKQSTLIITRACETAYEPFRSILKIADANYFKVKRNEEKCLEIAKEFDQSVYETLKFRLKDRALYVNYNQNFDYFGAPEIHSNGAGIYLGHRLFTPLNGKLFEMDI